MHLLLLPFLFSIPHESKTFLHPNPKPTEAATYREEPVDQQEDADMWLREQALPLHWLPAVNGCLCDGTLFVFRCGGTSAPSLDLDLVVVAAKQRCVITGGRRALQPAMVMLTVAAITILASRHILNQSCAN